MPEEVSGSDVPAGDIATAIMHVDGLLRRARAAAAGGGECCRRHSTYYSALTGSTRRSRTYSRPSNS